MATYNEIIYNILNINRDGKTAAEEPIQKEQILFMINYYRGIIIKRELNKKKQLDNNLIQNLGCLDVIKVDRNECCEIKSDCTVYRTKKKIPSIAGGDSEMFTYIGGLDKRTPFNTINRSYNNWYRYSNYGKKGIFAYYINDYIYIENYQYDLKHINVQGIFDNPLEATKFVDCDKDGNCELGLDAEYPSPGWMLQIITENIMKTELTFMSSRTTDNINDFKPIQTND